MAQQFEQGPAPSQTEFDELNKRATPTTPGLMGPADYLDSNGIIQLATSLKDGLMPKDDKAMLDNPESIIFAGSNVLSNAGYHNSVWGGRYLGEEPTADDYAEIAAGTFRGMFVGDYWTKGTVTSTIAGFDTKLHTGDTELTSHHIEVISDGGWTHNWNDTNDTSTGYVNSSIRNYIKSSGGPQSQIIAQFGDAHVKSYRQYYPTTYSGGAATSGEWTDARSELANEFQVYGCQAWKVNGYEIGIDKYKLPLFALNPGAANTHANWWLRSVYTAANACRINKDGRVSHGSASVVCGVRPLSVIV